MLVHGSNTRAVQDLLGHADQDTVVRYTQFLASDLIAQHRRSSPVAHLEDAVASPRGKRRDGGQGGRLESNAADGPSH